MKPTFTIKEELLRTLKIQSKTKSEKKGSSHNLDDTGSLIPLTIFTERAQQNANKINSLVTYIEKSLTSHTECWDVGSIKDNPRYKHIALRYLVLSNNIVLMHKTELIVVTKEGYVVLGRGSFGAVMFFSNDCQERQLIASLPPVQSLSIGNDCDKKKVSAIDALLGERLPLQR